MSFNGEQSVLVLYVLFYFCNKLFAYINNPNVGLDIYVIYLMFMIMSPTVEWFPCGIPNVNITSRIPNNGI